MDEQLRLLVFLLFLPPADELQVPAGGRLSALLSTGVCAQKPNLLALRAAERKLCRLPAEPQGKMLAPRNGGIRLCRHRGANSVGDRLPSRAKCWRLATQAQGFAGNGAPTRAVPGPPFPVFSARGWCTNPSKTLFFRPLCTKSPDLFGARPARTWCTDLRKALFFRPLCTKSPDLFGAQPAMGRQLGR